MRILVTGGRYYSDVARVWRILDAIEKRTGEPGILCVIEGASDDITAPYIGVDYWAHQWALARLKAYERYHAPWATQGQSAEPIRNGRMLAEGNPDLVVAFAGGRGTANMIAQARKVGIKVEQV